MQDPRRYLKEVSISQTQVGLKNPAVQKTDMVKERFQSGSEKEPPIKTNYNLGGILK